MTDEDISTGPPLAVVTGANGAMSAETARRLIERGWRVALIGRDERRIGALATDLGAASRPYVADATTAASLDAAFTRLGEELGPPTGFVHAVGSTLLKPAHLIADEDFDTVVRVNLTSAFYGLRAFVRAVPRTSDGSAVLFSTAATRIGLTNHEAIAAAKGGVDGLVTAAAASYAARGIRVNSVAPGLVRSPLTRRLTENEATLRTSEAMHPLGRVGEPSDVAGLVSFLLSSDASWVTGQHIAVDGGLSGIKLPPGSVRGRPDARRP